MHRTPKRYVGVRTPLEVLAASEDYFRCVSRCMYTEHVSPAFAVPFQSVARLFALLVRLELAVTRVFLRPKRLGRKKRTPTKVLTCMFPFIDMFPSLSFFFSFCLSLASSLSPFFALGASFPPSFSTFPPVPPPPLCLSCCSLLDTPPFFAPDFFCVWRLSPWFFLSCSGSSIPELKTILSGSLLPNFFSLSTFFARCVGLLSCICGGLSVGKEGPFVHLSSILAYQLCRFVPLFQPLISSPSRLLSLLDAAVATGVTATFGTPFGGVLFSVEVTATFFLVHALWKSYFCCIFCVLTFRLLHETLSPKIEQLYQGEQLPGFDLSWELCNFAVLGALCGCLGGLFVWGVSKALQAARRHAYSTPIRKVFLVCSVVLLLNLISHHAVLLKSEVRRSHHVTLLPPRCTSALLLHACVPVPRVALL